MEIGGKRKALALGLGPRRGLEVCAESLIIGELLPNGASYIGRCLFSCPIYIYSSQTARKSREPGLVDISCHRGLGGIWLIKPGSCACPKCPAEAGKVSLALGHLYWRETVSNKIPTGEFPEYKKDAPSNSLKNDKSSHTGHGAFAFLEWTEKNQWGEEAGTVEVTVKVHRWEAQEYPHLERSGEKISFGIL